jgi:ribonuclease J
MDNAGQLIVGKGEELVFVPLGGLGEIGMNAGLYGYGPAKSRRWILIDCGVSFAGDDLPGVDLIMPNLAFIERERDRLEGIIITHAHEDHIGALIELWPRLKVPVFATKFAADLLDVRRFHEPGAIKFPIDVVSAGSRRQLGPFDIEFIPVAHSIPESMALAIRTPLGTVVHTGDWKIDRTPFVGMPTDEDRLAEIGEEGVLALVCDSTNVLRDGVSPSESDVAASLKDIIAKAENRVAVTTFASNVARIRAVAEAAAACGREVVAVGRAMDRVIGVAKECGYLDGLPDFRSPESYGYIPRDKVVLLLTGSQGEPRAALARIAEDNHPAIALSPGDLVVLSSRTIPGNDKAVGRIVNSLVSQGLKVMTDRDGLVHVSGHPRRGELETMYRLIKPRIAVPAHGEALHLEEHRRFARDQGVPFPVKITDGQMLRLAPGEPDVIDTVEAGRLFKDGNLLIDQNEPAVPERRKLSFAGVVSIAIAVDRSGNTIGDVALAVAGLPQRSRDKRLFEDIVEEAIFATLDHLPKARRRDPDLVENAVERAVRAAVGNAWGKKPVCHVQVIVV